MINTNHTSESFISILKNIGCKKCCFTYPKSCTSEFIAYTDQLRISLIQNNMRADRDNYDTLIVTLNRSDDP